MGKQINQQQVTSLEMGMLVQAALDDPRPGDVYHEMYSYGVQVMEVDDEGVHWRSFSREELSRGVATREEWAKSFRYGDHMPEHRTMYLLERGEKESHGRAEDSRSVNPSDSHQGRSRDTSSNG